MPITKAYNWAKGEIEETISDVKHAHSEIKKALKNRKKNREAYFNANVNPQSAYKNGKKK